MHAPLINNISVDLRGAADILKIHPKTVEDLIAAGALPAAKIGRSYVMLVRDVVALLEQQIAHQTAERMRMPGRTQRKKALIGQLRNR